MEAPAPAPALELRLERERVQVRLAGEELAPGTRILEVVLEVPGDGALDVSAGPGQFRSTLCELERLEVEVAPGALLAALGRAQLGQGALRVALRPGFVELAGALADGAPFTAKLAPCPAPEASAALRVAVYEPRLYGPSSTAAPAVAPRLAASIAAALPASVRARTDGGFLYLDAARPALLALLPRRGWKLPRAGAVHAARAEVTRDGGSLLLSRWDPPSPPPPDPDLRALLHGAPAFAQPERLLADGELAAARDAWRALPPGARAHPFAAARTLGFLAADPRFHAEARALARSALERDPAAIPALLADAALARARGDLSQAAGAFSAAAVAAAARAETFSALAAADACAACGDAADRSTLGPALDAALALDRAHLPALRARRDLAEREGDRAWLLRTLRGLAAHGEAHDRAAAHGRLAELLEVTDPAAARLHRAHAREGSR